MRRRLGHFRTVGVAALHHFTLFKKTHDPSSTLGGAQQQLLRVTPLIHIQIGHQNITVKHWSSFQPFSEQS